MRFCIGTCTTPNRKWLYEITNQTKQKYCDKFGIEFVFEEVEDSGSLEELYWRKVTFMQTILKNHDFALWMDDDAGFVRYDFDIESCLSDFLYHKTLLVANDENGLNSGVYCLNGLRKGRQLVEWQLANGKPGLFGEQNSLKEWADLNPDEVQVINGHLFNAHVPDTYCGTPNCYTDDSVIVHIAGGNGRKNSMGISAIRRLFRSRL